MTEEQYSPLEAFSILIGHKVAYDILVILCQTVQQKTDGVKWKEIYDSICEKGISTSKGTIDETLGKLVDYNLIEKYQDEGGSVRYRITLKGIWSLRKYETVLKGPQLEHIPKCTQEMMTLHGWDFLLPAQREFIEKYFPPEGNLSIIAPPSAGKTLMGEICIFEKLKKKNKIIYTTPYKALNRQKYELFERIFGKGLGYKMERVDGDTPTPLNVLSQADVVVSTYERALGGVLKDEEWVKNASLAIADEITLLNDPERGSNLDLLLTFLKEKMQIITLSSHVGNPNDLRKWLGGEVFEYPHEEFVREFVVKEIVDKVFLEDREGAKRLTEENSSALRFIFKHLDRKEDETVLILVGPRAEAELVAAEVSKLVDIDKKDLAKKVESASDEVTPLVKRLAQVLKKGVAFHHAGITRELRDFIEDLLNKRTINTVVATPTLSHGVDFPIDCVVIFIDTFEFKKRQDDWTIYPGLSKLEYIQYRGRAGRIGRSKRGDVYVVSDRMMRRSIDTIRRNFLAKELESLKPSSLNDEIIDWIVLLMSKNEHSISNKNLIERSFNFIEKLLAFQTLDTNEKEFKLWKEKIGQSISRLNKYGFLDVSKRSAKITDMGINVAEINLTPYDCLFIIKNLGSLEKSFEKRDPLKDLLVVVSGTGLLRNFNGKRLESFITGYKFYCKAHNKPLPTSDFLLKCFAKAWVLQEWIIEKSLSSITSNRTFRGVVYDADIPRLGHYASMEMRKIASLAEAIGLEKSRKLAEELAIRLNKGIKSDLISENTDIDLFRLEGMGRRKARILYDHGYRTLLDIFSKIFSHGEDEFIKSCGLKLDEVSYVLANLKKLFQEDMKLKELCKDL